MKYLCLIYHEEGVLSPPDEASMLAASIAYREDLKASGNCVAAYPLLPVDQAATIRLVNGRASTTDGPYAETKEQLGGFYLIEARDLNDAIRIASNIPPLRIGTIEVRPIREV